MSKEYHAKFDGVGMTPIRFLPCHKDHHPSWCDVYVNGHLMFENVFVEITERGVNLFNGYVEMNCSKEPDYSKRVGFIRDNFVVVARKSDKYV